MSSNRGSPPCRSWSGHITDRDAILRAVNSLMRERGYDALTFEAVAARAGVEGAEVYRSWRSRADLVADMLRAMTRTAGELPNTGQLRDDLVAVCQRMVNDIRQLGPLAATVAAEAERNPELAGEFRLLVISWQAPSRQLITRAIKRRQLRAGLDVNLAVDLLTSIVWFRAMLLGDRTLTNIAQQLADPVMRAWRGL